jgi:glucose-6-phosphate 1-epimerase
MSQLDDLKQQFPANGFWHFTEPQAGILLLHIHHDCASATVSLYGGQVLSFQPRGEDDLLWLSSEAHFQPGKAIRGGIPICWPWFGPHPSDAEAPAHGTVRKSQWQLHSLDSDQSSAQIVLSYPGDELSLQLRIVIDSQLQLSLTSDNRGSETATISSALHSYFAISDITDITITGLEDKPFRDAVNNNRACLQRGAIHFNGELDRVYQNVDRPICIHDPGLKRLIRIDNHGSSSAVVWNPWIEKSARLGDMSPEGYRQMVCVETTNADSDCISLSPGQRHSLSAVISVEDL